jgi:hypothetical protein
VRVWRNNKLVYDARGNDWGAKNNGVFLKLARFYLGGWDQMPDPTLESIWGAGDVPGYRGTCYMVVGDEDLTDLGGTVPQFTFEVERAEGSYLTSRPYRVQDIVAISASPSANETDLRDTVQFLPEVFDAMTCAPGISELALTDTVLRPVDYLGVTPGISEVMLSQPLPAGVDYMSVIPSVSLIEFSISYTNGLPEHLGVTPGVSEIALI